MYVRMAHLKPQNRKGQRQVEGAHSTPTVYSDKDKFDAGQALVIQIRRMFQGSRSDDFKPSIPTKNGQSNPLAACSVRSL